MSALEAYFRIARASRTPFVFLLDRRYTPLQAEELRSRVAAFRRGPYLPERFDCDDFAAALRGEVGHGMGIAISPRHAWNVALCTDGVWHIEPQNGEFRRRKSALVVIL